MGDRQRVLFLAEAVTLAHVARPVALAQGLDPLRYEVVIACAERVRRFAQDPRWRTVPLESIPSEQFLRALARGEPLYSAPTLLRYVDEDRRLIEAHRPDLVVGDFRLSLSASARLAGVPYATITNAYWSPHYAREGVPLPVLPITRVLPLGVAQALFALARPMAFRKHCRPLNEVRKLHGLPSLGTDLRHVYTDADWTLYADVPELFPIRGLPSSHHYLGPILWSPPAPLPPWWNDLPPDRPIVYLTLGSSGHARSLNLVLDALAGLPVTVIAATAGAAISRPVPLNIRTADYLPGIQAAARSKLVVCNGGSLTCQQALAAGVPVLGIASNLDQFLNMQALVEAGVGILRRADRLDREDLRSIVSDASAAVENPAVASQAKMHQSYDSPRRFARFVATALEGAGVDPRVAACRKSLQGQP